MGCVILYCVTYKTRDADQNEKFVNEINVVQCLEKNLFSIGSKEL